MNRNLNTKVDTLKINFTPYALARMSDSFFRLTKSYKGKDTLIPKYFLYCVSIELGLKSSILSIDDSKTVKDKLKKEVSHNLITAYDLFLENNPRVTVFSEDNLKSLKKVNTYFKNKSLEYITSDLIIQLMNGLSNLPKLRDIRGIAEKVNKFLLKKKLYINL
jgi:hypothetical protein